MDLDVLQDPLQALPFGLRGLAGLVGVLLAVAGARFYRLAVLAPGLLLGIGVGLLLPETLDAPLRAIAAVVLAGFGAVVCRFVEQAAVRAFGALLAGGLVYTAWPIAMSEPSPWWAAAAGAALGLLLFPRAFQLLLKPLTAILGALALAFAVGQEHNPLVIGGVALLGTVIQLGTGGKRKDKARDKG
jgi:hypothetical protein